MADALLKAVLEAGPNAEASLAQLKLKVAKGEVPNRDDCRQIFEAGCALAVSRKDKAGLERSLAQLRPYGMTDEIFALYLLLLLVGSRLAHFFSLLETWDRLKSPSLHIEFVVSLERNLTEGSYHTALRARKNSTSPYFVWLLEDLEHTVREEVASCVEVSHKSISLQKAAELLNLDGGAEAARKFAEDRPDWTVENGFIIFPSRNQAKVLTKESIPADWTVRECLNMAVELDRIV